MNKRLWILLTVGLLVASLAGSPTVRSTSVTALPAAPMPPPKLEHHEVLPSQTDPKIEKPNLPHEVYVNADGTGDLLFMFLPGTGQQPNQFNKILITAAEAGYHAIGVDYPNKEAVNQFCGNIPNCYGPVRREIFDGQNESPKVDVSANDCILNRAVKLLEWLKAHHPNEHWGQFLNNGQIRWDKVTVSGHSQGGGHAAMIARLFEVHRVVMFSSVGDVTGGPSFTSAPWIAQPHLTPSGRYYGFGETHDNAVFPRVKVNWETLALPGSLTSVDNVAPPYGGSHRLMTSRQLQSPHNQVITDATPLNANGTPIYAPVWQYLIGP